jgi:hypothetical protein
MRFGFGGGISSILIAGSLEGPGGKFDTEGSGFGVQGMGEVLVPFTKRWSLSGILGYRYAKVDDLEIAGSSTSTEMDYSGVIVRIGVAHDWK